MTKLIIQIPCFNEAATLPLTLADLPREIQGIDKVEWLVIDDGSSDGTAAVAKQFGVDHIVRHRRNRGLAFAFRTGIDACLRLGADIIVNTDADNQYCGGDISKLIGPILSQAADIVVGDRQTSSISHFSPRKKLLQAVGSYVVRKLSSTQVSDAVSGFRAFSRDAAIQLNVVSTFSYTTETIIQVGRERLAVASVPINTNAVTRESRLFRSLPQFLRHSAMTILRSYAMYHPLRVFVSISVALMAIGALPILRFLYLYATEGGRGHVQSLILGGVFMTMGFVALLFGSLADLVSRNRQLLEMTLAKVRRIELAQSELTTPNQPAAPKDDSRAALADSARVPSLTYDIETIERYIESY